MVEEQAWKQLEAGKERQIRNNQNERLIDQCALNQIKVKDQTVRAENAKASVLEKLEYDHGFTDRLNTRKRENEVLHKNTLEYKASQHEKQQVQEQALKEAQRKRQPFNAKVNEHSLAKATAYRQKLQAQKRANTGMESLEFEALAEEEFEEGAEGLGGMDVGESGLDMLGDDNGAVDDLEQHIEQE